MPNNFKVTGRVERFPGKMGWHHVRVPVAKTKNLKIKRPKWGLIPARFTVGSTTWESSLLPYGDGTLFVALKASIRKKEKRYNVYTFLFYAKKYSHNFYCLRSDW